jgi:hemerythrin superfamily protein
MNQPSSSSRRVFVASVTIAGSSLLGLRHAVAQTGARADGDWLAIVKAQHELLMKHLDRMLDSRDRTFLKRDILQHELSYLITAHSVAEENVLYPAIARAGMLSEADRLYLDQSHSKIVNADLDLISEKNESAWFDKVRTLQAMVMKHGKQDEEGNIYPRLKQSVDRETNALLTAAFNREFASVKPPRGIG